MRKNDLNLTEATVTTPVQLSFKEYDGLIGGLMKLAKMYIKEGDLSKGTVILDWESGSNVTITFDIKPLWNDNKIEIKKAVFNTTGLEDTSDSKVYKIVTKYLTDFEVPFIDNAEKATNENLEESIKDTKSEDDKKELEYMRFIAGM